MSSSRSSAARSARQKLNKLRLTVGKYGDRTNVHTASALFEVPGWIVTYWIAKYNDPAWHGMSHGGYRGMKFDADLVHQICALLRVTCEECPTTTYKKYTQLIFQEFGVSVSTDFVRTVFKDAGWSWQKPQHIQRNKFREANVERYRIFLDWINATPSEHVKFLDECHFSPKDMRSRRALAPKGHPTVIVHPGQLPKSQSMSLLISNDGNWRYELREGSNSQSNFIQFLLNVVGDGFFLPGDIIVLDNARVHTGWLIHPFREYLATLGISVAFLPTYSPELNPCELVFAWLKKFTVSSAAAPIRRNGQWVYPYPNFHEMIYAGLSQLPAPHFEAYYEHCKHPEEAAWMPL